VLSSLMIYAFGGELSVLINFYVVGVFTSFTLSQTGMVRHWLAEGRKGPGATPSWRRAIVINAIGAVTTFVVLVVVIISKAPDGAWLSILIMAALVPLFLGVHRHYGAVAAELARVKDEAERITTDHVILLVRELDAAVAEALGYVRSFRPTGLICVHPIEAGHVPDEMQARWRDFAGDAPPLEPIHGKDLSRAVSGRVHALDRGPDDIVTVVIPETVSGGLFTYLLHRRDLFRLKVRLLREPGIAVTDVPVRVEKGVPSRVDGRPLIPHRTVTLAFVSSWNAATRRALRYASSLAATETRAIYFQLDPEEAQHLERSWFEAQIDIPLDIVEAPFRDLTAPMLEEIRRFTARPDTIVNVVIPELVVRKLWHLLLHNQSALFIKRLLLFEERAILTSVPFALRGL
jgi:hypothetical protein